MSNLPTPDTARENVRKTKESELTGTRELPMPEGSATVAGMPRSKRVHTEPGDPGNVAPENQVAKSEKMNRP
ncbi:MAG: hypothetical protein JHC61_02165 [Burkholderiaceae bacterium]|nr:hypothetical protein [Burkholderiaceae bacterium]